MSMFLNPDQLFFDDDGRKMAFGKLFFGEPNKDPKTNPKPIFSDPNFATQLSTEQTLSSTGRLQQLVYFNGYYSVIAEDKHGNQVFNEPSITGASGGTQNPADTAPSISRLSEPPTSPLPGDLWIDADDDTINYFDGASWILIRDPAIDTALQHAADAQATADGKIETFFQGTAPQNASTGDLWFDTSDGNKVYRYNVSAWSLVQDTGIAQAVQDASGALAAVDGKITTFLGASAPTANATGDLWINSTNNQLHRWDGTQWQDIRDSGISQAISDSAAALAGLDNKIQSFYQDDPPGSASTGDLWFDTDDSNRVYRYDGTNWIAAEDTRVATAINAASTAQSTADGKVTTFVQPTAPTAEGEGDLWIDTDNDNRLSYWNGNAWTDVRDQGISQALADASQAISNAQAAQDTADGKIVTFLQASQPGSASVGDLWIDSDDNQLYRYNGSSWIPARDNGITTAINDAANAQSTADGKVTTYFAASAPTPDAVGDLWYETGTALLKRWTGTIWQTISNAYTKTSELLDDANLGESAQWASILGLPTRFKDTLVDGLNFTDSFLGYYDGTQWQSYFDNQGRFYLNGDASNSLSWDGTTLTIRGDIEATSVAAGAIDGVSITGVSISGGTITGGTFKTNSSGVRAELTETDNLLTFYWEDNATDGLLPLLTLGTPFYGSRGYAINAGGSGVHRLKNSGGIRSMVGGGLYAGYFHSESATSFEDNIALYGAASSSVTNRGTGVRGDGDEIGVLGLGTHDGASGVEGRGSTTGYDFYASGSGTDYGPFTGAHDALLAKNGPLYQEGDIVSILSIPYRGTLSNILAEVDLEISEESKDIYGAIVWSRELPDFQSRPPSLINISESEYDTLKANYFLAAVNGVGEGQINVCDEGGNIARGDYIASSSFLGKGKLYAGNDMRVVVARAAEPVDWSQESDTEKTIACIYLCG